MRRQCLGLIVILALALAVAAGAAERALPAGAREALDLVAGRLLDHQLEGKRVFVRREALQPGEAVLSRGRVIFTAPAAGWLVFVDDHARANFEHGCRYVFVESGSGAMTVHPATTPPDGLGLFHELDTPMKRVADAAREVRPVRYSGPRRLLGGQRAGSAYAVLLSGGYDSGNNHIRYYNDMTFMLTTLKEVYGYVDQDIFVLMSDGTDPAVDRSDGQNSPPDMDGDGTADIDGPCTLAAIDALFADLATFVTAQDQVYVFTTDHGGSVSGWDTYLNLWNYEELQDDHLAALVNALPAAQFLFTMEQCFSGGFEDDLTTLSPRVFSSAAAYTEYSWAMGDLIYDEYVYYWISAVRGEDPYGTPVDADTNDDGQVTMDEAFVYAEAHDTAGETPQYGDNPGGLGATVSLYFGDRGTLEGTVTAAAGGSPLAATIQAYRQSMGVTYTGATSPATGAYSMGLPVDIYDVTASAFGYLPAMAQDIPILLDAVTTRDFQLALAPTGVLQGTVSDLEGTPIDGAEVTVVGTPVTPAYTNASGFYQFAAIPGGSTYDVRVQAVGFGEETDSVLVLPGETAVLDFQLTPAEAFESGDGNYVGTPEWEWGVPTYGPPAAHSGTKCWATDLDGTYQDGAYSTLDSRDYAINDAGAALGFFHWREMESYYDGGNVKISTDGGGTWALLTPNGGYPESYLYGLDGEPGFSGSGDWSLAIFDLSAYIGQMVRFRWTFGAYYGGLAGWYVDDVIVWGASGELLLPDMECSPEELQLFCMPGETGSCGLMLSNVGEGYLNYRILPQVDRAGRDSGGPDLFGYTWIDNDEPGGPAFAWENIISYGTQITGMGDDTNHGPFPIGFTFNYYGVPYTQFRFCTNGWISFTATSAEYDNIPLPDPDAPANMIAPFWDDLYFPTGGNAYYYSDGEHLVVSWINVPHISSGGSYTFQVILHPDGKFVYQYAKLNPPMNSATVGIQNGSGTDGLQVIYNDGSYLHEGLAIRFATGWLSGSPLSGLVPPGGTQPVEVTGDACELGLGDYTGSLTILSNDPQSPSVVVPVTFHVGTAVETVDVVLGCTPAEGALPFVEHFWVTLGNLDAGSTRTLAARIDATVAAGQVYSNWRSGYTNIGPLGSFSTQFNVYLPALGSLVGSNVFHLQGMDVTASPFNQPPYPPSGDTDTSLCTVTGEAPVGLPAAR